MTSGGGYSNEAVWVGSGFPARAGADFTPLRVLA